MNKRKIRDEAWLVLLATLIYLGVGIWFNSQDLIFPDTMSRVANGYYVLFSRDPHLAAIGFVWNPLPSLLAIPLLALAPLFPVLATKAFAGVIISVVAGVIAVVLARRTMLELGASRAWAMALAALFAVQPLVLISASTGASESLLMASALYVTLALTRWLRKDDPWSLVQAGFGLGIAYLVRYEAAPAALAVSTLVVLVSLWRSRGGRRPWLAALDWCLVAVPFGAAFLGWAVISRVVVGEWFSTFASQYGNSAQVLNAREEIDVYTGGSLGGILGYLSTQLVLVGPLLIPLLVIVIVVALRHRDARLLGSAAVLGTILAFDWLVFLSGTSFGWLRFQIMAIPWSFLLAAYLVGRLRGSATRKALSWVVLGALLAALPLAWQASLDPQLAREEAATVDNARVEQLSTQADMAAHLDGLNLPHGSVITDTAYSFAIVLASKDPRQFVITPDRDFPTKLDNPVAENVRYALLTNPKYAQADAVESKYPGMFNNGAGMATLKLEYTDKRGQTWRLYEFNK